MEKENSKLTPGARLKTDKSLGTERSKTDNLLERSNKSLEKKVDANIREDRQSADSDRELDREEADSSGPVEKQNTETDKADQIVATERAQADSERHEERKGEDALRRNERVNKSLIVEALLDAERKVTDSDLFDERAAVDSEAKELLRLLTVEQASLESSTAKLADRDRFISIVSHDLKNPLGAIIGASWLISEPIKKNTANFDEILKLANMIERHASSMDRMISNLLDVGRIAQGKLQIKKKAVKVCELVRDCKELFSGAAKTKEISITFDDSRGEVELNCDYDRTIEVLSNLIGNAVKFTPKGGSIEVRVTSSASSSVFSVKDNGPGISDEAKERIFEQFSQLQSEDRTGLGLGLFIAKWIVEAQGGSLSVSSKVGEGAIFEFSIPKV